MKRTFKKINKHGELVLDNGDTLDLTGANLEGANLLGVDVYCVDFQNADFTNAQIDISQKDRINWIEEEN